MPRKHDYSHFAIVLTWFVGVFPLANQWAGAQAPSHDQSVSSAGSAAPSPATHSPPISTPPQNLDALRNQPALQPQNTLTAPDRMPQNQRDPSARVSLGPAPQLPPAARAPASAVNVPLTDETEREIAEVRRRLGSAGSRFSDLLSPRDEAALFAEALSQVRQEQQAPDMKWPNPRLNSPQVPLPANASHFPPAQLPPNWGTPPAMLPSPGLPVPYNSNAHPPGGHATTPQWNGVPGQPAQPNPPAWPQPNAAGPQTYPAIPPATVGHQQPGNPPILPRHPGQPLILSPGGSPEENERATMRRIAQQVDALAEQLENIERYSEADALRRSAQQFREAVR